MYRQPSSPPNLYALLFLSGPAVRMVSIITLYRVITAPVLFFLLLTHQMVLFKWMLLLSFTTDALDGYLARKLKAATPVGALLDSVGDVLTLLVALAGIVITRPAFILEQSLIIYTICFLFVFQLGFALIRYKRLSSFHTYLAKIAAVLQGTFLLTLYFFSGVFYPLFYIAAFFTILCLIEEIILTYLIREWKINVKGLYWYMLHKVV